MKTIRRALGRAKRSLGFTLPEILLAIGILTVLLGVGTVQGSTMIRNTRQVSLDRMAEQMFIALSRNAKSIETTGNGGTLVALSEALDEGNKTSGTIKVTQLVYDSGETTQTDEEVDFYRLTSYGTGMDEVRAMLIPEGTLGSDYAGGNWVVTYSAYEGSVNIIDVYFSRSEDIEHLPNKSFETDVSGNLEAIKDVAYRRDTLKGRVGYYGGNAISVTRLTAQEKKDLVCWLEVDNAEKLTVTLFCNVPTDDPRYVNKNLTLTLHLASDDGTKSATYSSSGLTTADLEGITDPDGTVLQGVKFPIVLDSLTAGEQFKDFLASPLLTYETGTAFVPGDNLRMSVSACATATEVSPGGSPVETERFDAKAKGRGIGYDPTPVENSLFARRSRRLLSNDDVVEVSNGRHLQNLDGVSSGVRGDLDVVQTEAISLSAGMFNTLYGPGYSFAPINPNPADATHGVRSYDGRDYPITGLKVDFGANSVSSAEKTYAGLFGKFLGTELKNITLVQPEITAAAATTHAGALAGLIASTDSVSILKGDFTQPVVTAGANTTHVGGLVGEARTTGTGDHGAMSAAKCNTEEVTLITSAATTHAGGYFGAIGGESVTLNDCVLTGATVPGGVNAGGIAGQVDGAASVTQCSAFKVTVQGTENAGAIAGLMDAGDVARPVQLVECMANENSVILTGSQAGSSVAGGVGSARGAVTVEKFQCVDSIAMGGERAGGILGSAQGTVSLSESEVYMTESGEPRMRDATAKDAQWIEGRKYAGGLVGESDGNLTVTGSYAATVVKTGTASGNCAGGLAGNVNGALNATGSWADCYLQGGRVGGLAGSAGSASRITTCYTGGFLMNSEGTTAAEYAAGFVPSAVASVTNSYSVFYFDDPAEDAPVATSEHYYGLVASGAGSSAYYVYPFTDRQPGEGEYLNAGADGDDGDMLDHLQHITGFVNLPTATDGYGLAANVKSDSYPYPVLPAAGMVPDRTHRNDWLTREGGGRISFNGKNISVYRLPYDEKGTTLRAGEIGEIGRARVSVRAGDLVISKVNITDDPSAYGYKALDEFYTKINPESATETAANKRTGIADALDAGGEIVISGTFNVQAPDLAEDGTGDTGTLQTYQFKNLNGAQLRFLFNEGQYKEFALCQKYQKIDFVSITVAFRVYDAANASNNAKLYGNGTDLIAPKYIMVQPNTADAVSAAVPEAAGYTIKLSGTSPMVGVLNPDGTYNSSASGSLTLNSGNKSGTLNITKKDKNYTYVVLYDAQAVTYTLKYEFANTASSSTTLASPKSVANIAAVSSETKTYNASQKLYLKFTVSGTDFAAIINNASYKPAITGFTYNAYEVQTAANTVIFHYTRNQYVLSFDLDGGKVGSNSFYAAKQLYYGQAFSGNLPTATKQSNTFSKWTYKKTGTTTAYTGTTMPNYGVTAVANWTLDPTKTTVCVEMYIQKVGNAYDAAEANKTYDLRRSRIVANTNYTTVKSESALLGLLYGDGTDASRSTEDDLKIEKSGTTYRMYDGHFLLSAQSNGKTLITNPIIDNDTGLVTFRLYYNRAVMTFNFYTVKSGASLTTNSGANLVKNRAAQTVNGTKIVYNSAVAYKGLYKATFTAMNNGQALANTNALKQSLWTVYCNNVLSTNTTYNGKLRVANALYLGMFYYENANRTERLGDGEGGNLQVAQDNNYYIKPTKAPAKSTTYYIYQNFLGLRSTSKKIYLMKEADSARTTQANITGVTLKPANFTTAATLLRDNFVVNDRVPNYEYYGYAFSSGSGATAPTAIKKNVAVGDTIAKTTSSAEHLYVYYTRKKNKIVFENIKSAPTSGYDFLYNMEVTKLLSITTSNEATYRPAYYGAEYHFDGWYTSATGGSKMTLKSGKVYAGSSTTAYKMPAAELHLYARWKLGTLTATLYPRYPGTTATTVETTKTGIATGGTYAPPNPTKGTTITYNNRTYKFDGWYRFFGSGNAPADSALTVKHGNSDPITENLNLFGKWVQTAGTAEYTIRCNLYDAAGTKTATKDFKRTVTLSGQELTLNVKAPMASDGASYAALESYYPSVISQTVVVKDGLVVEFNYYLEESWSYQARSFVRYTQGGTTVTFPLAQDELKTVNYMTLEVTAPLPPDSFPITAYHLTTSSSQTVNKPAKVGGVYPTVYVDYYYELLRDGETQMPSVLDFFAGAERTSWIAGSDQTGLTKSVDFFTPANFKIVFTTTFTPENTPGNPAPGVYTQTSEQTRSGDTYITSDPVLWNVTANQAATELAAGEYIATARVDLVRVSGSDGVASMNLWSGGNVEVSVSKIVTVTILSDRDGDGTNDETEIYYNDGKFYSREAYARSGTSAISNLGADWYVRGMYNMDSSSTALGVFRGYYDEAGTQVFGADGAVQPYRIWEDTLTLRAVWNYTGEFAKIDGTALSHINPFYYSNGRFYADMGLSQEIASLGQIAPELTSGNYTFTFYGTGNEIQVLNGVGYYGTTGSWSKIFELAADGALTYVTPEPVDDLESVGLMSFDGGFSASSQEAGMAAVEPAEQPEPAENGEPAEEAPQPAENAEPQPDEAATGGDETAETPDAEPNEQTTPAEPSGEEQTTSAEPSGEEQTTSAEPNEQTTSAEPNEQTTPAEGSGQTTEPALSGSARDTAELATERPVKVGDTLLGWALESGETPIYMDVAGKALENNPLSVLVEEEKETAFTVWLPPAVPEGEAADPEAPLAETPLTNLSQIQENLTAPENTPGVTYFYYPAALARPEDAADAAEEIRTAGQLFLLLEKTVTEEGGVSWRGYLCEGIEGLRPLEETLVFTADEVGAVTLAAPMPTLSGGISLDALPVPTAEVPEEIEHGAIVIDRDGSSLHSRNGQESERRAEGWAQVIRNFIASVALRLSLLWSSF